jgi:hypothetical protein
VKRRRPFRWALPAILAFLLVSPAASAAATPARFPFPVPTGLPPQLRAIVNDRVSPAGPQSPFHPGFSLTTQDGYEVAVMGIGESVVIVVGRIQGASFAATAYVARGVFTRERIAASFGKFGRVSMRFRPSRNGRWHKPHRRCKGAGRFEVRRGVYVGLLRFSGEHDYIRLRTKRAKGAVSGVAPECEIPSQSGRERIIRPSQESPWGSGPAFLGASWRSGISSAAFVAIGGGTRTLFLALNERSEGRLAILRFAMGMSNGTALKIDDALTFGRVSPPKPFSGTGAYHAAPDGTATWTGPLAVNFPGAGHFALTGPPFAAVVGKGF